MNETKDINNQEDFVHHLKEIIEKLRLKLLDLTVRNPLIKTNLKSIRAPYIRVVDELPDEIHKKLFDEKRLYIKSLPSIEEDPKDEKTDKFKSAVIDAKLNDEIYLKEVEQIDFESDDFINREINIIRDLKDRVRKKLDMSPRQTKKDISLIQHAKNNNISPSYDLPKPDDEIEDERYTDNKIQTLFLPEQLETKINNISRKGKSSIQESGVNVLHVSFGFLEWQDPKSNTKLFSPLTLLPVKLEKKRTKNGMVFWIQSIGEKAETNFVLAEKLKREFDIEIPKYLDTNLEDYFEKISNESSTSINYSVRRQIVIGVFPSARMVMYNDLDSTREKILNNDAIKKLFLGSEEISTNSVVDENEIDEKEIEQIAPYLVLQADASQYKTIADIVNGNNTAVEGPPGTGKSQTIINAIANTISVGKKVLFIAEKNAALNVVKTKLESVKLGEFVLPLQADKSTKEQVIQSIRDRLSMKVENEDLNLEDELRDFRTCREKLDSYITTLQTKFGKAELTVYEILGKNIASQKSLNNRSTQLNDIVIEHIENKTRKDLKNISKATKLLASSVEQLENSKGHWEGLELKDMNKFIDKKIITITKEAAQIYKLVADLEQKLSKFNLENIQTLEEDEINVYLKHAKLDTEPDANLVHTLFDEKNLKQVEEFLEECEKYQSEIKELENYIKNPRNQDCSQCLSEIIEICEKNQIALLNIKKINTKLLEISDKSSTLSQLSTHVKPFYTKFNQYRYFLIQDLFLAAEIINKTDNKALRLKKKSRVSLEETEVVKKANQLSKELIEIAKELENRVTLNGGIESKHLRNIAAEFVNSGVFSFFSSSFKLAKNEYMTLSYSKKFNKELAVTDLRTLADWIDKKEEFDNLPSVNNILGDQNLGYEADFDAIEKLLNYYDEIEKTFPTTDKSELRRLLNEGDLELLKSIPSSNESSWNGSYDDLQKEIEDLELHKELYLTNIPKLEKLVESYIIPEEITIQELKKKHEVVVQLDSQNTYLVNNKKIKQLINSRFEGSDTTKISLNPELTIAQKFSSLCHKKKKLITELLRNNTESIRSDLKEYNSNRNIARAKLEELTIQTGQVFDHFTKNNNSSQTAEFLLEASSNSEELYYRAEFVGALTSFKNLVHPHLADVFFEDDIPFSEFHNITEAIIATSFGRCIYEKYGTTLNKYSGTTLNTLREELAETDKQIISLNAQILRKNIKDSANPPDGNGIGKKSDYTELSLLLHEITKKNRFVPVRDLTERAGYALQELKPCWMMSPLAVAQYIPFDTVEFDLCIIDEASQMPPEDALGAIARSKQTIVVGDTKQLPPTNFFRKTFDDEYEDEDIMTLEESILELANRAFRPKKLLKWHYRSKRSKLISFSNKHIYNDELIVFPSNHDDHDEEAVSLVKVDGTYKSSTNMDEAKIIVKEALKFMELNPTRSLGIVTLNVKQRELLDVLMDEAKQSSEIAMNYIDYWENEEEGLESFFIKNLENVQGDERDVIFIGTVFGPESLDGDVRQRFGPINRIDGIRRLNVLFTRAKWQVVTFTSMNANDINVDINGNPPGPNLLKKWLEFSKTGKLESGQMTGREPDSDFEIFVIEEIRALGYEAVPQVGVAGYFIDIGVKHPSWPHGYILGVECDGATYHSCKSARDRDRNRQELLEGLGWDIHRIWSTDWFNNPHQEIKKLKKIVEDRLLELTEK